MNGYHTYYRFEHDFFKNNNKYEAIEVLAQLASILFWKKNYGPIKLYANTEHLNILKKYGIEKEYDSIDTDLLDSIPYKDKINRYWSFSKIYVAKELAKSNTEFCIIDVDLWIKESGLIKTDSDFSLFHEEHFDENLGYTNYHDPINWMHEDDVEKFDWSCWPMNCAIMYFKNRTKELIDTWYNEVTKVIVLDKDPENVKNKKSTVFVEQRLLPTVANKLGISYSSIKPNAFLVYTFKQNIVWNQKWKPFLNSSDESLRIENLITHIWGRKYKYNEDFFRRHAINEIIVDLQQFPGIEQKYQKLFNDCYQLK